MIDHRSAPGYQAYMLRFWEVRIRNPSAPAIWRFSLEDPHTGERRGFADLEDLIAFLRVRMETGKDQVAEVGRCL